MEQCPVCKTSLVNHSFCSHCQTDLAMLTNTEAVARDYQQASIQAFLSENPEEMLCSAKKAFSKHRSTNTGKLLTCAALLAGDHPLALQTWRRLQSISSKNCHRSI